MNRYFMSIYTAVTSHLNSIYDLIGDREKKEREKERVSEIDRENVQKR